MVASIHFFCLLDWVECGVVICYGVTTYTLRVWSVVRDWNIPLPPVTWPLSQRKISSQGWIVNLPTEICWGFMETWKCWKYFFQSNSLRLCFFLKMTTSLLEVPWWACESPKWLFIIPSLLKLTPVVLLSLDQLLIILSLVNWVISSVLVIFAFNIW